jgi:hypothetical protein
MIQVELFENQNYHVLQQDINKFLRSIDENLISKILNFPLILWSKELTDMIAILL